MFANSIQSGSFYQMEANTIKRNNRCEEEYSLEGSEISNCPLKRVKEVEVEYDKKEERVDK